jgi:hypothetical protein
MGRGSAGLAAIPEGADTVPLPGQGQQGQHGNPSEVRGPMIARAVSLSLVVERVGDVRSAVERIATESGGMIASLATAGEAPGQRSLNATIRVPAPRLDPALAELRRLGRVRQESQSAEDVTDAHRDLVVRIANAEKEEARLNELLTRRTDRLQDVLAVEREVTRVRGEIERMKADEIATRNRVTYATVTLDVAEAYRAEVAIGGPLSARTQLRNALVDGWRRAMNGAFAGIVGLLEVGPSVLLWMLIIGLPAWWGWRKARRAGVN